MMAEHGFTPGPWVASYVGAGRRVTPIYSRGRVVAEARDEVGDRCNDFNAQLIAASPTLLEALEQAADDLRRASTLLAKHGEHDAAAQCDQREERARAAITLATGKDA